MILPFGGIPHDQPIEIVSAIADKGRDIILHILAKYNGNVAKTAQVLKIGKTAFYDKLKRYDISAKNLK